MTENIPLAEAKDEANQIADDSVQLNWLLFDRNGGLCRSFPISLPREIYEGFSYKCRQILVEHARTQHNIETVFKLVALWKPKEPLKVEEVGKTGWATSVADFNGAFEAIPFNFSLSNALDSRVTEADHVHLVVTIEGEKSPDTKINVPAPKQIPEFTRYKNALIATGTTPLVGATSAAYLETQAMESSIRDGLGSPGGRPMHPPIGLFHPIFSEFEYMIQDPGTQPPPSFIARVKDLRRSMSYLKSGEQYSEFEAPSALSNYLMHSEDYHWDNSNHYVTYKPTKTTLLVTEWAPTLGYDGVDLSIKAGLKMKAIWSRKSEAVMREKCCCPTFIIVGGGPWLCIMGGILTDRFVVQRLTDMQWMCISSTQEDLPVYRAARVLFALQQCTKKLEKFYTNLADKNNNIAPLLPDMPHPRFYPHPTSFVAEDGRTITFQYQRCFDPDKPLSYLVKYTDQIGWAVVKFVSRYGKDAHDFLARKGCAPTIRFYGPIPNTRIAGPHATGATNAVPGLCLHSNLTHMIVMDYVEKQPRPLDALEQLRAAIFMLHAEGYVFGNLTDKHILFDNEGKVKLVGFDWSGRFDTKVKDEGLPNDLQNQIDLLADLEEVKNADISYYPLELTTEGVGDVGEAVNSLEPIRPIHDWELITKINW